MSNIQEVKIINGLHKGITGTYVEDYYRNKKRFCLVLMDHQYQVEFDYDDVEFVEG